MKALNERYRIGNGFEVLLFENIDTTLLYSRRKEWSVVVIAGS